MKYVNSRDVCLVGAILCCVSSSTSANEIRSTSNQVVEASFDIIETRVLTDHGHAIFRTRVRADAGKLTPQATGKYEGSEVYAYVWPTSLNSTEIGFEKDQGVVALAVTFHKDFDDAANGARNRDRWHPHWVVLNEDKACRGGLKVKDIPEGTKPRLPETWPGAPILIDSPEYKTELKADVVEVYIPLEKIGAIATASFDGVPPVSRSTATFMRRFCVSRTSSRLYPAIYRCRARSFLANNART